MESFAGWMGENIKDRPLFVSDNNGFDWQFISARLSMRTSFVVR